MPRIVIPDTGKPGPPLGWDRLLFEAYGIRDVLDVGANIGGFVGTWLEKGARLVHAIEPVPGVHAQLSAAFAGDPRVRCHRLGVSDVPGDLTDVNVFNCWTLLPEASRRLDRAVEFVGAPPFSVELTTIDELCERWRFVPDFIKIDVDGYEVKALRGARRIIAARRPVILLELSYLPDALGDCCECMVSDLFRAGYVMTLLDGGKRLVSVKDVMRLYPWDTSFDVICEPVDGPPI